MNKNQPFSRLLLQPNFKKLWVSQLLSQLTINLVNFSILTHIYGRTGSTIAVSLLWISYSLPALLIAPFAAGLVDRFSLRRLMVITNLLQAATVASYLLVGNNIFLLYSLVFLYSSLDQLYLPSQQASIPWLVPKALFSAANGIFFLTQQASFLVGFGLGGVFLSLLSRNVTIMLSSLFLAFAAFSVSLLPRDKIHIKSVISFDKFFQDFRQGYLFVNSHPQVRLPLALIVFFQVFTVTLSILLPSYTHRILGLDLSRSGVILIIPGALGALMFTYILPRLLKRYRKKVIIQSGFVAASASLIMLSLLGRITFVYRIWISIAVVVGLGIALASVVIPSQTLLQEKAPEALRGRVYSVLGFLMTLSTTIPLIIAASLADLLGVSTIIGLMAVLLFAGFIFIKNRGDYVLANGSWL